MFNKILETKSFDLFIHDTKAKFLYCKNQDPNRVFSIAFKTPSYNNRGVFHILEHIVLMGSKKYPYPDPFNDMVKSAVYTYLNAITFLDKTVYPLASYLIGDFNQMTDVYLDAVFNPLLNEDAFLKEGFNKNNFGVVYNEMLGFFSDPLELLQFYNRSEIFQNNLQFTSYGYPDDILNITYSEILQAHKNYYNPSNAFIYLYGNLDLDYYLDYLEKYLIKQKENPISNNFLIQNKSKKIKRYYSGSIKYLSVAFVCGSALDYRLNTALKILRDYLLQTKIFEDYASDFYIKLESEYTYNIFSIILKNPKVSADDFENILFLNLNQEIDKKILTNCIDKAEFSCKEQYYGIRPKGLGIYFELLDEFMYGDNPENAINRQRYLKNINLENIIENYFLRNDAKVYNEMLPSKMDFKIPKKTNSDLSESSEILETHELIKTNINDLKNNIVFEKLEKMQNLYFYETESEIFYLNLYYEIPEINGMYIGINLKMLNKNSYDIKFDADVIGDKLYFIVKIKGLLKNFDFLINKLIELAEYFPEIEFDLKSEIVSRGQEFANNKVRSYFNKNYTLLDNIKYLSFYENLKNGFIYDEIKNTRKLMFSKNLIINLACAKEYKDYIQKKIPVFETCNYERFITKPNENLNSKFDLNLSTNYNSAIIKNVRGFSGEKIVMANIIENYFLLDYVRTKGGAYAYGAIAEQNGDIVIYSYKDPCGRDFLNIGEFFENFIITEEILKKSIITSANKIFKPVHISEKFNQLFNYELRQIEPKNILSEILNTKLGKFSDFTENSTVYFAQLY